MFGNSEAFQDKFKTCARSRPINCKTLGKYSHEKNSTRPNIKPCDNCNQKKRKHDELTRGLRCQLLGSEFHAKESGKRKFLGKRKFIFQQFTIKSYFISK